MSDDTDKVDEILDELGLGESTEETSPSNVTNSGQHPEGSDSVNRLRSLLEAGAITEEEYEILLSHSEGPDSEDQGHGTGRVAESQSFGKPLVTSEGTDMDFSIIGIFEDIATDSLVLPDGAGALDKDDLPAQFQGGPDRTLIFWQIYNHSDSEIKLKHRHIEHIGADKIAYNHDGNPLQTYRFEPGWRTDNWVDISPDTRIKYVSRIELPVELEEIKIDGYCSDIHQIAVTDEMRFPKSELPVTVDL